MKAKNIPLTELEGEIRTMKWGEGESYPCIMFVCPVCLERNGGKRPGVHSHLVSFNPGGKGFKAKHCLVWANPSGSTVDDITVSPSYLARGGGCRFHCFIRDGVVQVLGDSGFVPQG